MLLWAGLALVALHLAAPLAYFLWMRRWASRPPDVKAGDCQATVTVIVPTRDEKEFIAEKLENLRGQGVPLEVIVVDSSKDGTAEAAEAWAKAAGMTIKVVKAEPRGLGPALNAGLRHATGEVVVMTDADALLAPDALRNALKLFADPSVGAVTCLAEPTRAGGLESQYRSLYHTLRLGESRRWSTVMTEGAFTAYRRRLLQEVGGFPEDMGNPDCHAAGLIALKGYRVLAADDVRCLERLPTRGYLRWKVRRAQHLIQHLARLARLGPPRPLKAVTWALFHIHAVNPWLLPAAAALLAASAALETPAALLPLAAGTAALATRRFRLWVLMQLVAIAAALENLHDRRLTWEKLEKA